MKFNRNWKDTAWGSRTFAACAAVLLFVTVSHLNIVASGISTFINFFAPVIYGIIIAYVMDPLCKLFQRSLFRKVKREKVNRILSVAFAAIVIILLIVLLFVALIPQLFSSIKGFFDNLETYAEGLQALIGSIGGSAGAQAVHLDLNQVILQINGFIGSISHSMTQNFDKVLDTGRSIGSGIMNGVISYILAIYFLMDKKSVLRAFRHFFRLLLPEQRYNEAGIFWSKCNDILIRYIIFDLLDGLIIGVANAVFMVIAQMPYIALISIVVGVTNLAPTFGPIVGAVIGGFILLMVNPWYALWFLIFTVILQTIDGYVLKPKLFGGSLGIP
ncbi:MAG TPA: AI-2E family transporter, partial [Lachnospiraceae bacterium]|nr:AI-2E family transporter [Lachnospiraceae bacterium]